MSTPTIAFTAQVGSNGFTIAREVADRLGYGYHDWKITARARNLAESEFDGLDAGGLAERIMGEVVSAAAFEQEIPRQCLEHLPRCCSRPIEW